MRLRLALFDSGTANRCRLVSLTPSPAGEQRQQSTSIAYRGPSVGLLQPGGIAPPGKPAAWGSGAMSAAQSSLQVACCTASTVPLGSGRLCACCLSLRSSQNLWLQAPACMHLRFWMCPACQRAGPHCCWVTLVSSPAAAAAAAAAEIRASGLRPCHSMFAIAKGDFSTFPPPIISIPHCCPCRSPFGRSVHPHRAPARAGDCGPGGSH